MVAVREPLLTPVAIADLRPTQITVGMREVKAKRKRWREMKDKKGSKFLGTHMIPVILGPKKRHYVIDHHHLARALHEEGVKNVMVTVIANLSMLENDTFWFVLDNRNLMHPFDDEGRRRATKTSRNPSVAWLMIHSGRSPGSSDGRADLPRIRRHSASSYGRISSVTASSASLSRTTLSAPWKLR